MGQVGVSLTIDRTRYARGEAIVADLTVVSRSDSPAVLHFYTAQRFDLELQKENGSLFWRWSDGRGFAQMLGEETIGREALTYRETLPGPASDGRYRLVGRLTAMEAQEAAAEWLIVDGSARGR